MDRTTPKIDDENLKGIAQIKAKQINMTDRDVMDDRLIHDRGGKETEKKKWPGYCKTIMVTDSHGAVKELVFPKALDLDRPKRERTTFSLEQLSRLEEEFRINQYLVGKDRTSLARNLGLSETQVKVWFQNRRTKHKKDREKRVEDVDNQAESQAAQNVLKLLEYKTSFGYNSVLGGTASTNPTTLYEAIDMSNTLSAPHVNLSTPPLSNPVDLVNFSSTCPSSLSCPAPCELGDEHHLFDPKAKLPPRRGHNFTCADNASAEYNMLYPQCSGLPKVVGSTVTRDISHPTHPFPALRQPNNRDSDVLFPLGLRHFQRDGCASLSSEMMRGETLRAPLMRNSPEVRGFFSPHQATFPTLLKRPLTSSQHLIFQSSKGYGYPDIISSASFYPRSHFGTPQSRAHLAVHPSLTASTHNPSCDSSVDTLSQTTPERTGISASGANSSSYAFVSDQAKTHPVIDMQPRCVQKDFPMSFT